MRLLDKLGPALRRQERATIVAIVEQLVALRAPVGQQWRQLAYLAANHGELQLARAALGLWVEASGGTLDARFQKAKALFDLGLIEEAEETVRALPEGFPDPLSNAYLLGGAEMFRGLTDQARSRLDAVVASQPHWSGAWLALSALVDLAVDETLAGRIAAAEPAMTGRPPAERAAYLYALGKLHADRGNHDEALGAFARGAREMNAVTRYNSELDRRQAEEATRGYNATGLAHLAARQSEKTGRTIFVMGLPRSGTTLVQQILTNHSAVSAGAEFNRLPLLAREIGGQSCEAVTQFVERGESARAAVLWEHWVNERFGGESRIVDKSLDTGRFLGIAAAILPEAPLIWMTRDPLDNAWSCFRTLFLGGALPWSYDLADIDAHMRIEADLLDKWRTILGDRLLVVSYEDLVSESDVWIGRILAHCGLKEEPRAFAPHENDNLVTTASAIQVRRPIGRTSIGSAAPYRAFLERFVTR